MVEKIRRTVRDSIIQIINLKVADNICLLTVRNAPILDAKDVLRFCGIASECYGRNEVTVEIGKLCTKAVSSLKEGDESGYMRFCHDAHLLAHRNPKPASASEQELPAVV